jgi:hypothetical protein
MRKHHKDDNLGWEISFRKSSIRGRGSIPKDSSVRGSNPRCKDTFVIDNKGGDIYEMQDINAWREVTEACRQGEQPKESSVRGRSPKGRYPFSLMSKGET